MVTTCLHSASQAFRLWKQNERCGNKDKQAEFLKSNMDKIFGCDGYPHEWVDKLAEQGEEA